jgi:hypothetical protein
VGELSIKAGVHKLSKNLEASPKLLGTRRVTRTQLHTEDPQISGATIQNLVTRNLFTPHISFDNIKMAV